MMMVLSVLVILGVLIALMPLANYLLRQRPRQFSGRQVLDEEMMARKREERDWWESRRLTFNSFLIIGLILAYALGGLGLVGGRFFDLSLMTIFLLAALWIGIGNLSFSMLSWWDPGLTYERYRKTGWTMIVILALFLPLLLLL